MISSSTIRLATDQMAVRAALRSWMQPQTQRLATCFWWGTHSLEAAQCEARLCLIRLLRAAKTGLKMSAAARTFADEVLQDAIDDLGETLHQHEADLRQVAKQARQQCLAHVAIVEAVANAARTMTPLPPPWLVLEIATVAPAPARKQAAWRSRVAPERGAHA